MHKQKRIHDLTFTKFSGPSLPVFVKNIMEVRGHAVETTKRLYPRNTPEILINLAKPIQGEMTGRRAVIEGGIIQGSKTAFVEAWHPEYCHFISIRFTPNGYYKFLGISQKSFTNHVIQLADVIDKDLERLLQTLQKTPETKRRFRIVADWIKKAGGKTDPGSILVSDFIIKLLSQNPGLSVKQLTDKTGYTRKHLVDRFKEEVGLTIKEYQKIYRIYRVLKYVDAADHISWAQLAYKFGFYDQSHFIRNFKRYTGFTPSAYLNSRSESPKQAV
ncbi:AraC family transcriptional regulator [Aliifodinibius sp. S!AR15-10]|uniref:helix-turn-helix domain-containing protein n=1 Tax=Aliifodinibius sp. S!AR15-10 TaxID=2950437 RepID=UPI00285A70E0|nr:AraC family transcriptional regulator [Aliifodinibius sp. S!AR15-10]MDR8394545.1 AraC family transcriptional regulator [Aliifodinibius sp. S!AR15-10]